MLRLGNVLSQSKFIVIERPISSVLMMIVKKMLSSVLSWSLVPSFARTSYGKVRPFEWLWMPDWWHLHVISSGKCVENVCTCGHTFYNKQ